MIKRWLTDDVLQRVQQLKPIAEESGLSLAQLAIAWVLNNPNVASAIIGASRPEQVKENVTAIGVTLEPEQLAKIDVVLGDAVISDPGITAEQTPKTRWA